MTGRDAAVGAISALRMSLGIGAVFAPQRTTRLFGFPPDQITPSATLFGRWFGVREIVLASLALAGHGGATPVSSRRRKLRRREREFAWLNVANDAVDAAAMVVPVVKRQGLDRPQAIGIPVALAVSAGWLKVLRDDR